jgi:hypothetical protein
LPAAAFPGGFFGWRGPAKSRLRARLPAPLRKLRYTKT